MNISDNSLILTTCVTNEEVQLSGGMDHNSRVLHRAYFTKSCSLATHARFMWPVMFALTTREPTKNDLEISERDLQVIVNDATRKTSQRIISCCYRSGWCVVCFL